METIGGGRVILERLVGASVEPRHSLTSPREKTFILVLFLASGESAACDQCPMLTSLDRRNL